MRFDFKKIASVATSALMMGSTVALAAAASFPAPFVQSGAANVGIVYGSNAASSDLVAAADIQSSLSEALASQGGSGEVTIDGESYPLFTSGASTTSKVWYNSSINNARNTITDTELPNTLVDTSFDGDVSADLTHTIKIGLPSLTYSQQPTSDDDPSFNIGFSTSSGNPIYNATVNFDTAVNFTHSDSKTQDIEMFGQRFTVGSATTSTSLVLFRSANTVYLTSSDNPSETVEVDGETYTVDLVSASDTSATVKVTDSSGQSDQKEINEGSSKKFFGDVEVAVNTADESDALGTISAEVVVGASKIKMSNGDTVLFGSDEDAIDGTRASWSSGSTSNVTQLTIQVAADDSDNDALLPGQSFVDPVFGSFQLTFARLAGDDDREDIVVDGSGTDKVNVKFTDHQGTEKTFEWLYNGSNKDLHPDLTAQGIAMLGDSSGDAINVREMALTNKSQYIILGNEDDGQLLEITTINNQSTGYDNDKVTLRDAFSGEDYDVSITSEGTGTVNVGGNSYTVTYTGLSTQDENLRTVRIDDPDSGTNAMNLYNTIETSGGAKLAFYQPLKINLAAWDGTNSISSFRFPDGDGYTAVTASLTSGGTNWTIGGTLINTATSGASTTASVGRFTYNFTTTGTANTTNVYLVNPAAGGNIVYPAIMLFEEQDQNDLYQGLVVTTEGAGDSSNEMGVNNVLYTQNTGNGDASSFLNYITHDSDSDFSSAATMFGTVVTKDASTSSQTKATLSYPAEQVNAEVYITEVGAATGSGSDLGSISVMDSEVSQVSGKNLIVVGGSCVNTVAAKLLGSDSPLCSNGWQSATSVGAGQFLIQTFNSPFTSGRVATLVAGYNAGDTTNAATFFTTQNVQTDSGKKYVGSSATSASLVTN